MRSASKPTSRCDILVICAIKVSKLVVTVFTSLYYWIFWPNWLNFFGHLKQNSVHDRKKLNTADILLERRWLLALKFASSPSDWGHWYSCPRRVPAIHVVAADQSPDLLIYRFVDWKSQRFFNGHSASAQYTLPKCTGLVTKQDTLIVVLWSRVVGLQMAKNVFESWRAALDMRLRL